MFPDVIFDRQTDRKMNYYNPLAHARCRLLTEIGSLIHEITNFFMDTKTNHPTLLVACMCNCVFNCASIVNLCIM